MFNCSEFEELEAVPTLALMDGPLEPSSSMSTNTTDVPDDPAFVNFFSVRMLYSSVQRYLVGKLFNGIYCVHT
jgi:hypothetical protein